MRLVEAEKTLALEGPLREAQYALNERTPLTLFNPLVARLKEHIARCVPSEVKEYMGQALTLKAQLREREEEIDSLKRENVDLKESLETVREGLIGSEYFAEILFSDATFGEKALAFVTKRGQWDAEKKEMTEEIAKLKRKLELTRKDLDDAISQSRYSQQQLGKSSALNSSNNLIDDAHQQLRKELKEARAEAEEVRGHLLACSAVLKLPRLTKLYRKAEKERLSGKQFVEDEARARKYLQHLGVND